MDYYACVSYLLIGNHVTIAGVVNDAGHVDLPKMSAET